MMKLIMMQTETAKLILDSFKTHQFERCPLVGGPFFDNYTISLQARSLSLSLAITICCSSTKLPIWTKK